MNSNHRYVHLAFFVTRITDLPSAADSTPTVRRCTRPLYLNELRPLRLFGSCTINTSVYLAAHSSIPEPVTSLQIVLVPVQLTHLCSSCVQFNTWMSYALQIVWLLKN